MTTGTNDDAFPSIKMGDTPADYDGPMKGTVALPWVGPAKGKLFAGELVKGAKAPHNASIKWTIELLEPGFEGRFIIGTKPYDGLDVTGRPLVRNIDDIMWSVGYTKEQIHAFRESKQEFKPREFINTMLGQTVYFEVSAGFSDDGTKEYSNVDNFMAKKDYDDAMATPGMGRRPRPTAPAATAPVQSGPKKQSALAPSPPALGGPGAIAPAGGLPGPSANNSLNAFPPPPPPPPR